MYTIFEKKRKSSTLFILLVSAILLLPSGCLAPAHAVPASKNGSRPDQIEKIETELSREKEQLLKFGTKEKTVLGQLSSLEKKIDKRERFLKALKKKIRLHRSELKRQQEKLSQLEQTADGVRERLSKRLTAFYKYAKRGYVQIFAAARDLEQLRKGIHYLQIIMNEDQNLLREMAAVKQRYDKGISSINERLAVINNMEKEEKDYLSEIKKDRGKKVLLLMKIHQEKEFYETAVKELELAAQHLKETLLSLDLDQSKKERLASRFAEAKGKLPLPFNGRIIRNHSPLGIKPSKNSKGIYIGGPIGSQIRAIYPGRVDFSGWLKGYGQIIVINHGSRFFTISAHLAERYKKEGDMAKAGEVIGRLGQTGSLEGPKLYFEMRRAGNHIDPFKWLKVH